MDSQIHGGGLPIGWACQYRITETHRLLPSAIRRSANNPPFTILPSDFRTENVVIDDANKILVLTTEDTKNTEGSDRINRIDSCSLVPRSRETSGSFESVRSCARTSRYGFHPATATTGRFSNGLTQFVEGAITTAAC